MSSTVPALPATESDWRPTRFADLSDVQPGRALARLRTQFGLRDYRGKILRSLAGGDSPRSVSYFCSESGVIRPLAEFDEYKLLEP